MGIPFLETSIQYHCYSYVMTCAVNQQQQDLFVYFQVRNNPANIRLGEDTLQTLKDIFRVGLQKTFSKCLQDVLIKANLSQLCVLKASSRPRQNLLPRRFQDVQQKRLEDVFKTSSRRLVNTFSRRLQTSSRRLAKMFSRHLQGAFKASPRHLQAVSLS